MEETAKKEAAPKKSRFKSLKAEFKKIIWPDQSTLVKQTIAVFASAIVLGLIIALLDAVIKFGLGFII